MCRFPFSVGSLLVAFVLGLAITASAANNATVKASLQAAMQQHIDRSLVNKAYLHLDSATGEVVQLYPVSPHPMIMQMGKYFVLCADFRDRQGTTVNVDFYMAKAGRRYVVFHTAIAQRDMLERWMKAGKVEQFD